MGERTSHAPGTFSWADLSTTDTDGAKAFYTGLFGWDTEDNPMPEGGVYCFTAEAAHDDTDFELTPGLRYAHSQRYLRELAARHGFTVAKLVQQPIREDQRQPVAGLYVYLTLPQR